MDGLCIARPTSSPDEFALIDRTTPTLRFIWNTGNLVLGLMPKQLIFVTLVVVFTASCSQDFLWQGGPGSELHAYRASFTASAGRELVAQVPRAQLLRDLKSAQILWLGDHHRHSRLHALQMELLQQLQQQGRAMCLGLEAIGVQDQPLVDDFLAGEINMRAAEQPSQASQALLAQTFYVLHMVLFLFFGILFIQSLYMAVVIDQVIVDQTN